MVSPTTGDVYFALWWKSDSAVIDQPKTASNFLTTGARRQICIEHNRKLGFNFQLLISFSDFCAS